jgi:hypothetical protein
VQVVAIHPPAICKISKDKHADQAAQEKRATLFHIHVLPVLNRHFGNDPLSKTYVHAVYFVRDFETQFATKG